MLAISQWRAAGVSRLVTSRDRREPTSRLTPAARRGSVFVDHPMEQLFEVLVIHLHPADNDVVMIREHEERARRPAGRHRDADLAAAIVVQKLDAFAAQLVEKARRLALHLETIAIVAAPAQLAH